MILDDNISPLPANSCYSPSLLSSSTTFVAHFILPSSPVPNFLPNFRVKLVLPFTSLSFPFLSFPFPIFHFTFSFLLYILVVIQPRFPYGNYICPFKNIQFDFQLYSEINHINFSFHHWTNPKAMIILIDLLKFYWQNLHFFKNICCFPFSIDNPYSPFLRNTLVPLLLSLSLLFLKMKAGHLVAFRCFSESGISNWHSFFSI